MATRKEMSDEYFRLKALKDQINSELKTTNESLTQLEVDLVLTMESEGLQSFKDSELGTIFLREEVYASIEDSDRAFTWLRHHDMGDVIKETVHAKTLAAIVKDHGEIPGVKDTHLTKIGIRRM